MCVRLVISIGFRCLDGACSALRLQSLPVWHFGCKLQHHGSLPTNQPMLCMVQVRPVQGDVPAAV